MPPTLRWLNFLQPTDHVMHQQFNIQQLYALPHTVFMCFVFIREQTATCATYSINWLVFITETKSVYSAVRTGSLNKAVCPSSVKDFKWSKALKPLKQNVCRCYFFNTMYRASFIILYYNQQMHNYFANYHTPTCFDTVVSSSGSLYPIPCQVTQVFQMQLLVIQFTIKMFHVGFIQVLIF